MNLRRKAAETLENVTDASTKVSDAASMQTILFGVLAIGVLVAIGIGITALNSHQSFRIEMADWVKRS